MGAQQSSDRLRSAAIESGEERALPEFFTLKSRTHDVASGAGYIPKTADLADELLAATRKVWPTRHRSRYKKVEVLLLYWDEDDLGVIQEVNDLESTFKILYNYNTELCCIKPEKPDRHLKKKIYDFIEEHESPDTLMIVYYAGHARPNIMPSESPDWVSRRQNETVVYAGRLQSMLEECDSDVLLLYDCCHAVHPASGRSEPHKRDVREVMAACGFESIAAEVGEHSFTRNLIEVLAASATEPHTTLDLHTRLIARLQTHKPSQARDLLGRPLFDANRKPLFEPLRRRTPVYYRLTNSDRSIILAPLNRQEGIIDTAARQNTTDKAAILPNIPQDDLKLPDDRSRELCETHAEPHVLLSIRLASEQFDVSQWVEWIRSAPREAQEVVNIEGVYGSYSTCVILRVPVSMWDVLPSSAAISFIDFVTTSNQASVIQDEVLQLQKMTSRDLNFEETSSGDSRNQEMLSRSYNDDDQTSMGQNAEDFVNNIAESSMKDQAPSGIDQRPGRSRYVTASTARKEVSPSRSIDEHEGYNVREPELSSSSVQKQQRSLQFEETSSDIPNIQSNPVIEPENRPPLPKPTDSGSRPEAEHQSPASQPLRFPSKGKYAYIWYWACHCCGFSPMPVDHYSSCLECGHVRCEYCVCEQHKSRK